jgi:hypothetical protein
MALNKLTVALDKLEKKFEDPVDIEKKYRESIEQRLENFKKHQTEVQKNIIDPIANSLTSILSIGDKDKWGKYE